jgi:glycosyltransferase involved in cell wall biosynthesis
MTEKLKWESDLLGFFNTCGEIEGLRFVFLPERPWAPVAWRLPGVGYVSYNLWQRRAFRVAQKLHAEIGFDLVHHVTIIGFREPGYLWKLGPPFIWGPIGGTQNYPWRFLGEAGLAGGVREAFRTLVNRLQLSYSRRVRDAGNQAAVVLTANSTGQADFERILGVSSTRMAEIGIWGRCTQTPERSSCDRIQILWCGTLEPRKAISLLLKALAQLTGKVEFELHVIGKDLARGRYQRLARKIGIDRYVIWHGEMPHTAALRFFTEADVFVFTSLRDTGGTVVLEAMAAGLPLICLDHQGAHDSVSDECGIKIPVTTPGEVIAGLSDAILDLAKDPARRYRLGRRALERVKAYHWHTRGKELGALYRRALGDGYLWQRRESVARNVDPL